ncbi:MAG: hypothetical protein ACOC97_01690 [Myxococcota bacterium]
MHTVLDDLREVALVGDADQILRRTDHAEDLGRRGQQRDDAGRTSLARCGVRILDHVDLLTESEPVERTEAGVAYVSEPH